MERGQPSPAERFVDDLKQLRQRAGQPSYSVLERLSGHELKRATMSDVLNGNRVKLPDWPFVQKFVTACRAAAAENQLDENELGTVADWKRHWDSATDNTIDARFPGRGGRPHEERASNTQPAADSSGGVPARPSVWGPLPPPLPDFVGRKVWLDTLHQALTRKDRVGVVALQGLFGVGKSQLAIEYANRYAHEYDLVWWIPCDSNEAAHAAMADLASRTGAADPDHPDAGNHTELFDMLRRRERFPRWLLVFDNADDPEEIRGAIPPLPGNVLITTRSNRWEASGDVLELDVFDRAESIEFLRGRMRNFTDVTAHRLAEGVGDLPLLLEHAVESQTAVDVYLDRLNTKPMELLNGQPADYHSTIADVWKTAVSQLRSDPPDAFDLLCCLSFFGPDPVPRESLERGSFLTDVSIHDLLRGPIRLAGAIARLRRAGLLRVRTDSRSLTMHRITRCVVRGLISSAREAERFRHDVHLLLAAADPLAPADPATWQSYTELRGHTIESDTIACQEELVRKFVVNLVRSLSAAGDPRAADALADTALARWDADAPDDGVLSADSRTAMRAAKADALFAQGAWPDSFRARQEALDVMRSDPGRSVAEILEAEGRSGARCRITGNLAEALETDQASVRAHRDKFGDDDPRTFTAMHSLIVDLALNGSGADAADRAHSMYRNCLAFYGDPRHPAILASRNVFGRCRWICGEYDEAVSVISEVHAGYGQLSGGGALDENHPWRLVHEIDYAITRRDNNPASADLQALADIMHEVRRRCWRTLGADHPQTIAATVVLGSVLRRVDGQAGEAVQLLEDAAQRYQSALPGHPYGYACDAFLAAVRYQAVNGDPRQAAAQAASVIQDKVDRLTGSAGAPHPLSLTALSALANALARAGEPGKAAECEHRALAGFRDLHGPDHPHTLTVAANLKTIQSSQISLIDLDFTPLPL